MTRQELMSEEDIVQIGLATEEMKEADVLPEFDMDGMDVNDVIALTARLANVMAKEADLLESQRVGEISELQREKQLLTHALESAKRHAKKHPEMMQNATDEEVEDLQTVITLFDTIKEENHRRLKMAKAVNERIVQAITDVVNEERSKGMYNDKGTGAQPTVGNMSVSLNERV